MVTAAISGDRGGIDNRATRWQEWSGKFAQPKVRIKIGMNGFIKLRNTDIGERFLLNMNTSVID